MGKRARKTLASRSEQRRRFDHSIHPHTRPGTIIVPPDALPPVLRVTCYGPDDIVDKHNVTLDQIRQLRGKHPVMWIDAAGFGDAKLIEDLGQLLSLHHLALEDMVSIPQRSKVEDFPAHLFAVTQIPSYAGDLATEQLSVFTGKGFVLSWRERPGTCFDIARKRLMVTRGTTRSAGVDYLYYVLLDAVIDSYFPVLEKLGEVFDELDDRVEVDSDPELIAQMRDIRHDVRQMRRIVWPLRDAIDDLVRSPPEMIGEETLIHFRDCHDHTVQIIDTLENYRDAGSDLRDYYATSISNRMNETIKVLTIISTIFMPLTFIAGIYGMNFNYSESSLNMPELHWKYGYPFSLLLMAAVAIGQLIYFRRKGWIGRSRRRNDETPGSK
jgi:magnesium transporter